MTRARESNLYCTCQREQSRGRQQWWPLCFLAKLRADGRPDQRHSWGVKIECRLHRRPFWFLEVSLSDFSSKARCLRGLSGVKRIFRLLTRLIVISFSLDCWWINLGGTIRWFSRSPQKPSFSCVSPRIDFCGFLTYPSACSKNKGQYQLCWSQLLQGTEQTEHGVLR